MGCSSCGKSAGARVGNTLNTAIVLGEPHPDVHRVRVTGDIGGLQTGAIKYVRGTNVQTLAAEGKLAILAGAPRRVGAQRPGTQLYYVGAIGYTSLPAARVRSGQTGEEIVVKTIDS